MLTRAEASGYRETSRHADVMAFVGELSRDPRVRVSSFGTSPEGRDLPLIVVGDTRPDRPVVLVQNGIHAGEVEGKESSLMLLRDLLADDAGILQGLTLLVVPLFNPDGNDAIDPRNRALDLPKLTGQDGPASGVGTRTNAAGINLNRDYMRQAAPEMRALQSRVCQVWNPDLTIDTHATNGSVHRMSMTWDVPHTVESGRPEPIVWMRDTLVPAVGDALRRDHGLLAGWYGNFVEDEAVLDGGGTADPRRTVGGGWMTYPHHPRFGSNYRGLGGRMDLLLECYSYLPFPERVRTTYATLLETLRFAAAHGGELRECVAASRTPRDRIAVRYRLEAEGLVTVPTRSPRTREGQPSDIRLPHFARFVGTTVVDRPAAYLVPPNVAEHLVRHGLRVDDATGTFEVEVPTVERVGGQGGRGILEAAQVGEVSVSWRSEPRRAPPGWRRVPTDQPLGAVAVYLCEPESDDGLFENGLAPSPRVGDEVGVWRAV